MATNSAVVETQETDFEAAQAMLRDLFGIMGIKHVVVVDDELSTPLDIENIIGAVRASFDGNEVPVDLRIAEFTGMDLSAPVDAWRTKLEGIWAAIAVERQDEIARALNVVNEETKSESERHVLERVLGHAKPEFLSLTEWGKKKDALIQAAKLRATLFLFDQDMTKDHGGPKEGMTIIADLLKNHCKEGPVYFGLFSHTIGANEEYKNHLEFVEEFGLQEMGDRFAVISKAGLDSYPKNLACRLKRVAISPLCSELKNGIFSAVTYAVKEAQSKIEGLHIYDFEHLVFRSSFKEGVWEVDTLLRLFTAFFRESARAKAASVDEIRTAAEHVRRVVSYPYRPDDAPEARVREVARIEMYESGNYLRTHRMPIELGDIFKKTGGKTLYMLLEQPCDLMVRGGDKNKGKRQVEFVTLAEIIIVANDKRPPNAASKLDYYSDETGKELYVRLEKCRTVPVCILDLCVCSDDGLARIEIDKPMPVGLIPAWQERYKILQSYAKEILARYKGLTQPKGQTGGGISKPVDAVIQANLLQTVPGLVNGKIDAAANRIEFELQRVGKLRQPWSGGVLRDYAYHKARDAFDHDLTRTEED